MASRGMRDIEVPKAKGASEFTDLAPCYDAPDDATCCERVRDTLVIFFRLSIWKWLAIPHILIIIGSGALFFFLLMGWHVMCTPVTDCEPRNWWYNWSIQVLNVAFTYGVLITMPERLANAAHLWCSRRSSAPGCDWYGRDTKEIWFHIPAYHRKWVVLFLLGNTFGQYINQGTRIVYSDFYSQNVSPGNIWTNVFFFQNMLFAFIAAAYAWRQESLLRRARPNDFPPDVIRQSMQAMAKVCSRWRSSGQPLDNKCQFSDDKEEIEKGRQHSDRSPVVAHTKNGINATNGKQNEAALADDSSLRISV